ncbi:MAG: PAS domain S-box protein, partial [Chloroflexota bacterium]
MAAAKLKNSAAGVLPGNFRNDLELYFGSIPSIQLVIDPKSGRILYANHAACEFYGLKLEEITKRGVSDLAVFQPAPEPAAFTRLPGGRYQVLKDRHVTAGRQVMDVEITPSLLQHASGDMLVLSIRDLTPGPGFDKTAGETNSSTRNFPASDGNLRLMLDSFPGFVVLLEPGGSIVYWNQEVTSYLGINKSNINHVDFSNTIHPEDLSLAAMEWGNRPSEKEVFEIEIRVRGADWTYHWFLCRIMPILDNAGKTQNLACLLVDINSRKQSELAQQINEENTRLIYRTSMDAILICTSTGTIMDANISAASMFGFSESELIGFTVPSLLEYEQGDGRKNLTGNQKELYSGEMTGIRKDGSRFSIEAGSASYLDVNGSARCSVFIRDITLRKQAEAVMDEWVKELTCLSETGQLLEIPGIQLIELFNRIFSSFAQTFPQPEHAGASLQYEDVNITIGETESSSPGQLVHNLLIGGVNSGSIKFFYADKNRLETQNKINLVETLVKLLELWLQRQKTELEIRKLSLTVEQSPLAVMITNPLGEVEYINPGFTSLTGYQKDEILGFEPIKDNKNILTRAEQQSLLKALASNTAWHSEISNTKKDGTTYWASINVTPIHAETGSITNFVSIMEDITERKKNQQVIHDALNFSENIFQVSPVGMVIYDSTGQCIKANTAAAEITGGSLELLLQQNYHTTLAWKNNGIYEATIKAEQIDLPVHIQGNFVSSFGKSLWLNIIFVRFSSGDQQHLLMVFEDNTLQKSTEASF